MFHVRQLWTTYGHNLDSFANVDQNAHVLPVVNDQPRTPSSYGIQDYNFEHSNYQQHQQHQHHKIPHQPQQQKLPPQQQQQPQYQHTFHPTVSPSMDNSKLSGIVPHDSPGRPISHNYNVPFEPPRNQMQHVQRTPVANLFDQAPLIAVPSTSYALTPSQNIAQFSQPAVGEMQQNSHLPRVLPRSRVSPSVCASAKDAGLLRPSPPMSREQKVGMFGFFARLLFSGVRAHNFLVCLYFVSESQSMHHLTTRRSWITSSQK
jgi:hypothetical protein